MSVTKSISNTLFRILPLMDTSTTTTTTTTTATTTSPGVTNGGNDNVRSPVEIQGDIENGDDAASFSSDSSCSSCVSSCPSFVNERESLGPYRLVKTLGVGEFGKIKLGIHTETDQKVAIKVIKKNNDAANLAKVEREIQVLKSLRHPHIVKLIEVVETENRMGIILEYASGGELFEYVLLHNSLEEDIARNIFAQLISSVNHMHMKGIVHRDLKLENLLFLDTEQTHIIISDFGFANGGSNNKDLLSTCCGSPTYAAPELVYPSGGYKGPAADVWSCGVILYCMVCGYLPFDDDPENPESANIHRLYQYIRSSSTLSFPVFVSDDAQDLIRKMLQHDPAKRCSVDAIINHPWLQAYRSTLFDMSTEQLEKQAMESIKKHQMVLPPTSTSIVTQQNRHQAQTNHHHHRHRNQLSAIQENQQHQEEHDEQKQKNNNELNVQTYKFLELNDHADNDPPHEEGIKPTQSPQLHDANEQTQNDKDSFPTQATGIPEQSHSLLESGTDYKPLELTQVDHPNVQDQQDIKSMQNGVQKNSVPTENQQDQGVLGQTQHDNQGMKQDIDSTSLESKEDIQQPSELSQQETLSQTNISQNTATLAINENEQQQLSSTEKKQDIPDRHASEVRELPPITNGAVEKLSETENKLEEPALTEDQEHEMAARKNQEHQEPVQNDANLKNLVQENQHPELDQCSLQRKTGLTHTTELSQESPQSDDADQKLDRQETQSDDKKTSQPIIQQSELDQHKLERQTYDDDHEADEIKTVQIYSEQPSQHPMDIQLPIATSSTDNETTDTAKISSLSHPNDKETLSLPSFSPIPNGEMTLPNDSGIKEQQRQRQPSLRRQKKFRPSLTEDEPLPINTTIVSNTGTNTSISANINTNTKTNNDEVKDIDQNQNDEESNGFIGIRPSLLGKDGSTQYYSAMVQSDVHGDRISNRASYSDDGGNDDDKTKHSTSNSRSKVQNLKTTSLPLLNHPSNTMATPIDANTSTTNLNDAIKKYNNGSSLPTSPRKHHKRFSSILSLNHATGPRPQRSQSTHLPKKSEFKSQEKESSPSPTTTTTTTSTTKLPVARKRTVTQTVKAWIHNKKKPFSKQHHHHRPSSSSLSESTSSGDFDGHEHLPVGTQQQHHDDNDRQQRQARQQIQIQQYRAPSSPSSSVETPTIDQLPVDQLSGMRTLPHAQGENLTSMAPGHLILALVRMLTALGIDVKHDSSYQLTCLRKSCHHQKHSFNKKRNSKPFTAMTAPIYGPPELDHGHHVEFSVEICRSLLSDLHVIDIQLTNGDALAFQFLRSKLLALLNLNV